MNTTAMKGYKKIKRDTLDPTPGFFNAMVGLLLHPADTTENLLSNDRPPYVILMFLFTVATACLPIFFEITRGYLPAYHAQHVFTLIGMYSILLVIFIIFETAFLFILGIRTSLAHMTAALVYSLIPIVVVICFFYIFSYSTTGSLSFMDSLFSGQYEPSTAVQLVIPYAIMIAQVAVLLVFLNAIKVIGELFLANAIVLTAASSIPLALAVWSTKNLMELVRPGISLLFPDMLGVKALISFISGMI